MTDVNIKFIRLAEFRDKLNIPFGKPYSDVKVAMVLDIMIDSETVMDDEDISAVLGICKFDIMKFVGQLIEKKAGKLK